MSRNRIAKRALAGILSAAFVLAALPAYAEESTGSGTTEETTASENTKGGSTAVTFSQDNEWLVSIPSSVTLSTTETKSSAITATKINIEPGKELQVSVRGGINNGVVTLTRENGNANDTITSTVSLTSGGQGIADNEVVAVFTGTKTGLAEEPIPADNGGGILYFSKIIENNIAAGSYKGTITFTMKAVETGTSGSEETE